MKKELQPEDLTLEEVGACFRRSAKTIRRWVEEGKYFNHDEIMKFDDGSLLITRAEVERVIRELRARELEDARTPEAAPAQVKIRKKGGFVNNW
ncbi:MAG: hypothetical protein ACE5GY_07110 [Thermodesulfobacteriota bacterium]